RIDRRHEYNRHGAACLLQRAHDRAGRSQDDIRRERDQLRGVSAKAIEIARAPAVLDPHVTADTPAQFGQSLRESRNVFESCRIALDRAHKHTDAPHPLTLLRVSRKRPRRRRAAEQRYELAALHSITSSARVSSAGGTSSPSACAVLRLMNSSIFVDCW